MTELDPGLVTVGKPVEGGCCFTSFAENPTLPTAATSKLSNDFVSLGELSENGFTESTESNSTDFKGWHGKNLLTEVTDQKTKYKGEFVEVDRLSVAQLRYGKDNVTVDATNAETYSAINVADIPSTPVPLIFDELESNGWLRRTVIPKAKIDSIDDVPHQRGSLMLYGMSFTAEVDANGVAAYIYHAKPAAAPAGPSD